MPRDPGTLDDRQTNTAAEWPCSDKRSVDHVQIAVAEADCAHLHHDLVVARSVKFDVADDQFRMVVQQTSSPHPINVTC